MRLYLATDSAGTDWRNQTVTAGTVLTEGNENYRFLAYKNPTLAAFLNPFFDNYHDLAVWECTCPTGRTRDVGLRSLVETLHVHDRVAVPAPTLDQFRRFALVCAVCAYPEPKFLDWANKWLNNEDRSDESAKRIDAELDLDLDVYGQDVATAAVASVVGLTHYPQYQKPLQYYAAAAGWRCHVASEGKIDLLPAATFALEGN